MNNIKVGIVEDEMIIAEGICDALEQAGYTPTEPAASYSEALTMIERERPDILLLDIVLSGKKDGIDLAWKIREDYNIPFIFLTANSDAATVERAKKLCPPAYLVKPFNKNELYTSIEICLHNFATLQQAREPVEKGNYIINDCLFIKQGNNFHKVKLNEILYLECDNVYVNVYTPSHKFVVRTTIHNYLELLGGKLFFRIQRSYAVNLHHVQTITGESVFVNNRELPLGKAYRDELLAALRLG